RLLAFAHRGELRAEPLDAADLLSGLRDVLSHTLGSGIAVDVRAAAGLPPLLADKGQLETALVNLATNARDAMPDGGTLTFAASAHAVEADTDHPADLQPGGYILVSVADTGSGIEAPLLARVLEPFFSTKPAGQGTGLGLSMAKGFAEQSGGGLTIDSVPERGTTICLWFPQATRPDAPHKAAEPSEVARDDAGKRVLLVDDEAMVRETLAASLEDAGYTVLTAADGSQALDLLRSPAPIDILITDLSMPGMDGLALIQQARYQRPALPAVLLTGYAGNDQAEGGPQGDTYTLVRKPVTGQQLAVRIASVLAAALTSVPEA
ncbi:MAG TPA: response regulator, partial [Rhodopila sp.]